MKSFEIDSAWNRFMTLPVFKKIFIFACAALVFAISFFVLWVLGRYFLFTVAESLAKKIAIYTPLNEGLIKTLSYVIFIVLVPITAMLVSFRGKRRQQGIYYISVFFIFYFLFIGVTTIGFKVDPLSGAPKKCYVIFDGKVIYHELVSGQERVFDPETGERCQPVTPELAGKLSKWELGLRPKRIDDDSQPEMFDPVLGTPNVWYARRENGRIELFDDEGFHPISSLPLQPITPDVAREWKAQQERRRAQEARRRKAEEKKRQREQENRRAELEEERRLLAARTAAGDDCDRLAGNRYDRNRNRAFPGVSYSHLLSNAGFAVDRCKSALETQPRELRYRYQLARALQASGSSSARQMLLNLTRQNYAAAYDNYGWALVKERRGREALEYFRRGANLGNAEAMVSLANFLTAGQYVQRNSREALRLLNAAAEQGHPEAVAALEEYRQRQRANALGGAILGAILGEVIKRSR